jgi:hypothetical protein
VNGKDRETVEQTNDLGCDNQKIVLEENELSSMYRSETAQFFNAWNLTK